MATITLTTTPNSTTKANRSALKTLIKNNQKEIFVKNTYKFDSMIDGVVKAHESFRPANLDTNNLSESLLNNDLLTIIDGLSKVVYFFYEDATYIGFEVCSGGERSLIATKK